MRRKQTYTGNVDEELPSATKDPSENCQSSSSSSYFQDKNVESSQKTGKTYDLSSNENSTELEQHRIAGKEAEYGQKFHKAGRVYQQGEEEFFPDHAKTSFPHQNYDYYCDKSVSHNHERQYETLSGKYTQPGYTSVIVDAQQLQIANGYAHWELFKHK